MTIEPCIYNHETMKQLIRKYNHSDTLAVVSLYPKKGEIYSAGASGISSYAKNTVSHLPRKVIVLSQYEKNPFMYEENNALIMRCFGKNKPVMWVELIKTLIKFTAVKKILVHFDFALYGSMFTSALIIPFLAILKFLGYEVSVVVHSVVTDIATLSGHVGLKNNLSGKIKTIAYNLLFHNFYRMLGFLAHQVIVNEEKLQSKLSQFISARKIITIPHGVDTQKEIITKDKARKRLGFGKNEQIIMFFGFINWFKGTDFFVDAFRNQTKFCGRKVRFIIAGGESATLRDKKFYADYYSKVIETVGRSKNIEITGYVPQNKIAKYFASCDLVVFPYRSFICASGVLSLVFSFKKPFIISNYLGEMLEGSDFSYALASAGLAKSDLIFDLEKQSLIQTSEKVLANGLKPKMARMAEILSDKRSFVKTASFYNQAIFAPQYLPSGKLALGYTYIYEG